MNKVQSNFALLFAAAIWGFAFVAQRVGMDFIGPFTYNGLRFALGCISILPLIFFLGSKAPASKNAAGDWKSAIKAGLIAGVILFIGASFQQIGLLYTEAGKAAFITGLYIVMVPLFGVLFLKQRLGKSTVFGSVITTIGLYFLCIKSGFEISVGDLYEFIGAFFWTAHLLVIHRFSQKVDALKLAFFQCATCSMLSLAVALIFETFTLNSIGLAMIPILYGGICSVGVAYTLQIIGQKNAHPTHAAIILSMEVVFAAIGGFIILNERLDSMELLGCFLMLVGMLVPQFKMHKTYSRAEKSNQ